MTVRRVNCTARLWMALPVLQIAHATLATLDLTEVIVRLAPSTRSRTSLEPRTVPRVHQTVAMLLRAPLRRTSAFAYLVTQCPLVANVSNARPDTSKPFTAQQHAASAHLATTFLQLCSFFQFV